MLPRISGLMTLGLALSMTGGALPARAELRTFGNWLVGCDNKAECTAIGRAESTTAPTVALRIGVDHTSLSGFEFALIPLPLGQRMSVTCMLCANGLRPAGHEMTERIDVPGQRVTIPPMQGALWLDALGKGRAVSVTSAEGTGAATTIDTSSFMAAWTYLARTRGDLMRRVLSAGVETAPAKEERARAFPAHEVMPSGTPGIELLTRTCPGKASTLRYRQFALPGNVTLWALACKQEAGTSTQHWFQASGPADLPAALELPDGERGSINAGEESFAQSGFDFDFGILRARSGQSGREDCGIQRAWGWDGKAWFLLERREMPLCIGLAPQDWIRTYAAP